jgi:hypothetical protein
MSQTTQGVEVIHLLRFEVVKHFQSRSKSWTATQVHNALTAFQQRRPTQCTVELEKPSSVNFGRMIYTIEIFDLDRDRLIQLRRELEADLRRATHRDVAYRVTYRKCLEYPILSAEAYLMTGRIHQPTLCGADTIPATATGK